MKKPLTREEAKAAIENAIQEGRVKFANPKAAMVDLKGEKTGWVYVEASPIPPFHPRAKSKAKFAHDGGIHWQWGRHGLGFGEASMVQRDGVWVVDTEGLGQEFLKELLCVWVDSGKEEK